MSPTTGTVLLDHVVPRLKATLPRSTSPVAGEDAEELFQDATAMAARLLHQAEAARKEVTPGNIAYYTRLHIRSGRRFNSSGSTDVMGARTQLTGRSRVASLDEPMLVTEETSEEPLTLGDVLSASAILDRFLHHAQVIAITGRSYRLKDQSLAGKEAKKKATKPHEPLAAGSAS